ncbi:MAG UNVERIFIED_CONTAM: hypothetical protein LVT10_01840 [Anaerolineae bacterium]
MGDVASTSDRRLWAVMLIVTLTMVLYLALLYTVLELRYVLGMVAFWMVLASLGRSAFPHVGIRLVCKHSRWRWSSVQWW